MERLRDSGNGGDFINLTSNISGLNFMANWEMFQITSWPFLLLIFSKLF